MLTTMLWMFLLAQSSDDWMQLIPRVELAASTGSVEQLERCRESLLIAAKTASGPNLENARYTLAYVDWRLHPLLMLESSKQKLAQARIEEAEAQLKSLVAANASHAEGQALLSSVLGIQIGNSMWKGMTLGPKASAAMEAALKLDRDNPRIALQSGVGAFFTPKMFGGGMEKAEKEMRRAEALFAREPVDQPWPNWGRADVLIWMGQVLAARGDRQGARTYYERVLKMQPDHGWVKYVLLPGLDKPGGKK